MADTTTVSSINVFDARIRRPSIRVGLCVIVGKGVWIEAISSVSGSFSGSPVG